MMDWQQQDQAAYLDELAHRLEAAEAQLASMRTNALQTRLTVTPDQMRIGAFSGYGQPQVAASGQAQSYALAPNSVDGPAIAAGSVATSKLTVVDGMGRNLCPNGSFQLGSGTAFGYTPMVNWGWVNWLGVSPDGVYDSRSFRGDVVGPNIEARYSLPEFALRGGTNVTVSWYVKNRSAGSPSERVYLLCRKAGTAVGSWDYAYLLGSDAIGDYSGWIPKASCQAIPSDVVAAFLAFGMVSNPGVGAGYESQIGFEDFQVQYGTEATPFEPCLTGGAVVIDSQGITVQDGWIAVVKTGAPGGDVIIDGTSGMFKIVATGTLRPAAPGAGASSSASVDLSTGLAYTPASTWLARFGTGDQPLPYYIVDLGNGAVDFCFEGKALQVNGNQTRAIATLARMASYPNTAAYDFRYYIFKEAGI